MSDFFVGELLVLMLLLPVMLRPFIRSLQAIHGIVFLPPVALCICLLIVFGSGFPVSFTPLFITVLVINFAGFARIVRALRGLATDWYSLPSRIFYLILLPVFLCVIATVFLFAPESRYLGSAPVENSVTRESSAAGVLALQHHWRPVDGATNSGLIVFFGDSTGGATSRPTLAGVLAENGYFVRSDDFRSYYTWNNSLMAWPFVRFAASRFGQIVTGQPVGMDPQELYQIQYRNISRTMASVLSKSRDTPLFLIAEGSMCAPLTEYLYTTGRSVQGLVCLVSPEQVDYLSAHLESVGFEGRFTVVSSETSMIPRFSAHLPVLVLSGGQGTMIGRGELDADDILAAILLGGTRDTGRKRAERLSRRIAGWLELRMVGEGAVE